MRRWEREKSLITMAASLAVTVTILGMSVQITEAAGAAEKTSPLNVEFVEAPALVDEDAATGETVDSAEVEAGVPALPGAVEETHTAVSNNGEIPAFVFMEVSIPLIQADEVELERGVAVRPDGWVPVLSYTPLPPWTLIEEDVSDGVLRSVYTYGDMLPLAPGQTTAPLFDSWTLINCRVKGSTMTTGNMNWWDVAEMATDAHVTCYSIQTALGPNLTPETVWASAH